MTRVPNARDALILKEMGEGSTFTSNVMWEEPLRLSSD
jgi:hypothetical protein